MELSKEAADSVTISRLVQELPLSKVEEVIRSNELLCSYQPDGVFQTDPRNGDRVVYNSKRAKRPHDNKEVPVVQQSTSCVICEGKTTPIIDRTELSEGFTFINENLFPMVFPFSELPTTGESYESPAQKNGSAASAPVIQEFDSQSAWGCHLLQWTSSLHRNSWENMPLSDLTVVLGRLGALEQKLLTEGATRSGRNNSAWGDREEYFGAVSIIKNYGRAVGGSLEHDHQQICYSNVFPRTLIQNYDFEQRYGRNFAEFILNENPKELTVCDFGECVLLVPYFMKRPYDMLVVMKDPSIRYLHEMSEQTLAAVANAWQCVTRLMHVMLTSIDRDVAFNILVHNGPGAGVYLECMPYSQEYGGYERIGLYVTQNDPMASAESLRKMLPKV